MGDRQESKSCGDVGAHEAADLVVHVLAVHYASQPEMDRPVRVAHAFPHPRVEIAVGGGEVVVDLAVGPVQVFVNGDLAQAAQAPGQVPAF